MQKLGLHRAAALAGRPIVEPALLAACVEWGGRLLPGSFFLFLAMLKARDLLTWIDRHEAASGWAFYATLGSRISILLFFLLMVTLFVVRSRPRRKAAGFLPRATAILGTFSMSLVPLFPHRVWGPAQMIAGTLLTLVGGLLSVYVLAELGRSFSIMAEARGLVTRGSYALVRHPLYLAEEIAVLGVVVQSLSAMTLLVFALHLFFQLRRMKNEEHVLGQAYPEYQAYQRRTARLIPGVY